MTGNWKFLLQAWTDSYKIELSYRLNMTEMGVKP